MLSDFKRTINLPKHSLYCRNLNRIQQREPGLAPTFEQIQNNTMTTTRQRGGNRNVTFSFRGQGRSSRTQGMDTTHSHSPIDWANNLDELRHWHASSPSIPGVISPQTAVYLGHQTNAAIPFFTASQPSQVGRPGNRTTTTTTSSSSTATTTSRRRRRADDDERRRRTTTTNDDERRRRTTTTTKNNDDDDESRRTTTTNAINFGFRPGRKPLIPNEGLQLRFIKPILNVSTFAYTWFLFMSASLESGCVALSQGGARKSARNTRIPNYR